MTPSSSSGWEGSSVRWAWSYARPYRRAIVALAALSSVEIALRVLAPFALMIVIDHGLGTTPLGGWAADAVDALGLPSDRRAVLFEFAALSFLLQLGHQIVVMAHGRVSVTLGQRMIRDVRERMFAHVQALTLQHHSVSPVGDAVRRLETDARCIEHLVLRALFPGVFSLLTLVVMFCVLASLQLTLALLAVAVVPPLYLWLRLYAGRMSAPADHAVRTDSRLSARLVERIAAIRLVKSHGREEWEQTQFAALAGDAEAAWIDVGRSRTVFAIVNGALTLLGSTAVLVVGGLAVFDGAITVGTLLLVLAYLGYVYGPLSAIAHTANEVQQAVASARRVRELFATDPEPADVPGAISADRMTGDIAFEQVSFAYGDGPLVLDHVSFTARPGELVALVGPSGAGKSTLATMLVRFHEPRTGRITIDGRPIAAYQLRSLRQRVALVLQDALLLSGTVRDNVRYGRLDAGDDEVEAAARDADAHDFIAGLPNGYDTEIGERGASLSGGQRQRLSIARAFLRDAPILILDEPTSALDTLSERAIVESIRRLWRGRTTFVVAHRLSTVRRADRILVMDRGRIVGEGTHDELRRTNLLYRQLAAQLHDDDGSGGGGDDSAVSPRLSS